MIGTTPGSFAEYVLADHRHATMIPTEISYEDAAALPTGLLTEHGALQVGGFRSGHSVLITAATSSIGMVGVQLAKALGASHVIATTRSGAKTDLLWDLGADTVVVTGDQDLTSAVLAATDGDGVDVVLDHVGGQTFADAMAATRLDGTIVNIGRLGPAASTIDLDTLSHRHLNIRGVSFGFTRATADGRIDAVIDQVCHLSAQWKPQIEFAAVKRSARSCCRCRKLGWPAPDDSSRDHDGFLATRPSTILLKSVVPNDTYSARFA